MARIAGLLFALTLIAGSVGCGAPSSFVRTNEATWASIELSSDQKYDTAWANVVDLITHRFDMEVLSKESGYARTNWLYTWTGDMRADYRVRATVKFSPDHTKVDLKSEAEYLSMNQWILGTDTRLLDTMKSDIMGVVGRTTR